MNKQIVCLLAFELTFNIIISNFDSCETSFMAWILFCTQLEIHLMHENLQKLESGSLYFVKLIYSKSIAKLTQVVFFVEKMVLMPFRKKEKQRFLGLEPKSDK